MRPFLEMVILITVAILLSFAGNTLNPAGIPLFGQWDPDRGNVHAGGPCAPPTNQIADIDVMDLYLSSGAVFVDARIREEYEESHIPRSVNLPINEVHEHIYEFMDKFPLDTRLIVYCSGVDCTDSHDVSSALKEYGYKNVQVYAQGIDKWKSEGRPLMPEETEEE